MTTEEIFSKICARMIKGLMFHEQLGTYYHFLGLEGYKCCHEYHYFCESISHLKLQRYYVNRYNKLIPEAKFDNPDVIPSAWYKVTRQEVGNMTRRAAVKEGVAAWLKWEKEPHECYTEMYKELMALNEVSAMIFVKKIIEDVEEEINYIEHKLLNLETVDFSFEYILTIQEDLCDKYENKMKKMWKEWES